MRRTLIFVAAGLAAWPVIALAQQTGPRLDSPGTIAVWSTVITQKQEYCRLQARARKLTYWERRRFIRECIKN
jgi:hypothetical protein